MNRHLTALLLCTALAAPLCAQAAAPTAPAPANLNQALSTLADQPATHTGFVFDRSTLQLAQNLLESNGMDPHRAAVALSSISVDSYHYPQPAFYTPEAMAALLATYHAAGWKHLANVNQNPANTAQPKNVVTDLWLHFTGGDIDGVTVLSRGQRNMDVIQLQCDLKPLDLVHLSGHFGIPRVDPNALMVPDGK
jgi:hypothetical protein